MENACLFREPEKKEEVKVSTAVPRFYAIIGSLFFFLTVSSALATFTCPAWADPPVVPWSQISGPAFPQRQNLPPGFFIHRKGNQVVIVSHGVKERGLVFTGRIMVEGGTIVNPEPFALERQQKDAFKQQTPNVLDFRMLTYGKIDGVKFKVNGGQRLYIDLRLAGKPTERVFFGPKPVQVVGNPIVCDMTR